MLPNANYTAPLRVLFWSVVYLFCSLDPAGFLFLLSPGQARPTAAEPSFSLGVAAGGARPPFSLAPWGICVMNSAGIKIPPWSPDLSLQKTTCHC